MWRLLSEELRVYRPVLLASWAFGVAIFGLVLAMIALLGNVKDRADILTVATQLPVALLIASMVAGFIVTGTEWSENRVRLLVMLPLSIRQIALTRVLLPTAMLLLGLLLSHLSLAAMLAIEGQPPAWMRHLKVEFIGVQLLLWVLVALVVREVIEVGKARGHRAGLAPTAFVVAMIALVAWLLVGPFDGPVAGTAVLVGLDATCATLAFAMFCHRTDFTR